jgi:hypothetical protein
MGADGITKVPQYDKTKEFNEAFFEKTKSNFSHSESKLCNRQSDFKAASKIHKAANEEVYLMSSLP